MVPMHLLVLVGAIALILLISFDTFRNISFVGDRRYLQVQFWICLLFLLDIVLEFSFSRKSWLTVLGHLFFFLICVPYINIIDYMGITVTDEWRFVLRVIPMVRAAYVLAMVTGTFTRDRVTDMFTCYLLLLLVILYFSSMMFFVEEHKVNPDVHSYWSALWWAIMTMTTAGCYINEFTTAGRIMSVILSGGGLILFPVFTVYIAHAVTGNESTSDS